jgi:DNA-binding response OmpR family regulator
MKILIVEDEPRVGHFVERGLEQVAYVSIWVRSCKEANDALVKGPFDAVILDLSLPDGDGLDLLREWRATGFDQPVLILSARDAVHDRITGLNLGADDYLAKPWQEVHPEDSLMARRLPLRWLMRFADAPTRRFVKSFPLMTQAYVTGAMAFGLFVARKRAATG